MDDDKPLPFVQIFHLSKTENGSWFIANEIFRWTMGN
jgi:hypothetical protein